MRWWKLAGGTGIALAIIMMIAFWPSTPVKQKLNLILITLDTTRADHLGCYGHKDALTPAIDGLAQRGVLFERAYSSAPFTLPAHTSMHTGLYPYQHGLFNNGMSRLNNSVPTLADTLARAGYATGAFVGSYVLDNQFGLNRGFLVYDDTMAPKGKDSHGYPQRSGQDVVDSALPWLTKSADHPFFCWLHFYDPHFEYLDHSETFADQFRDRPYDGEIAFVDRQIQRVLDFLESQKLADRTLVIVVGDHGEGLGEHLEHWHGNMLYNSTLHVPLIVSLPSQYASGKRVSTPISIVDVAATALDCLGLTPAAGFSGSSLKPALLGQPIQPEECYAASDGVYVEEGWSPLRSLVTEEWKYIQTTKPELYNLKDDPKEETNLAALKPEMVEEFENRLREMESHGARHEMQTLELTGREKNVLEGLGYLQSQKSQTTESDENLPDVKEMAAVVFAFQTVQELYWRRQKELAVSRLHEILDAAPQYLAPRLMLGRVLESEGKLDEAKEAFEGILKVDADNKEANARLGKLLAKEGQIQLSLPYLNRSLDRDAKGNRSTYAAEALPFIMKEIEKQPNSVDLHYIAAKMLRASGRQSEALVQMQKAEVLAKQQRAKSRAEP